MKSKGLSVVFNTEEQFKKLKNFLGESVVYVDFVPQMLTTRTAIVINYDDDNFFSIGSVGSATYQEKKGCRLVEFDEYFK